jgi:hypothetical protein
MTTHLLARRSRRLLGTIAAAALTVPTLATFADAQLRSEGQDARSIADLIDPADVIAIAADASGEGAAAESLRESGLVSVRSLTALAVTAIATIARPSGTDAEARVLRD